MLPDAKVKDESPNMIMIMIMIQNFESQTALKIVVVSVYKKNMSF